MSFALGMEGNANGGVRLRRPRLSRRRRRGGRRCPPARHRRDARTPSPRHTTQVGQEATIGWLRHSEIKHGRIAMAAFLGFIAQCTPLVSGEHKFLPRTAATSRAVHKSKVVAPSQSFILIGSSCSCPGTLVSRHVKSSRCSRLVAPVLEKSASSSHEAHPTHWLICAQVAGCTPQEQWDNIPLYGKLQIFVLVGMLESYGEGASQPDGYVHYM